MIDAVLSYHMNPHTCGVTKFNLQLAERLGVPHASILDAHRFRHPLLSLKASEGPGQGISVRPQAFDLLWHDAGVAALTAQAARVTYATETGCPSTLRGNPSRQGIALLTYGMCHKFNMPHFARLKALLDAKGAPYTVCVSSAIHEGSPWDETTQHHVDRLRAIFGHHLRWLGFLADDALAREIHDAHTIALFYDPAVRANNTTIWAALDAGTPVITNLDIDSPPELRHNQSVFNIHQLTEWPEYDGRRQDIRSGGRKASAVYSWDRLIGQLTAVHA